MLRNQAKKLTKHNPNSNGSIIIATMVLVLFAGIVALGIYKYTRDTDDDSNVPQPTPTTTETEPTPTPTPSIDTSNWKTYTNEQYGYSFMYPSEFVLKDSNGNDITVAEARQTNSMKMELLGEKQGDNSYLKDGLVIITNIHTKNGNMTLEDYFVNDLNIENNATQVEFKTLEGKKVVSFLKPNYYGGNGEINIVIIELSSTKILSISGSYSSIDNDKYLFLFQEIFNSLEVGK